MTLDQIGERWTVVARRRQWCVAYDRWDWNLPGPDVAVLREDVYLRNGRTFLMATRRDAVTGVFLVAKRRMRDAV